MENYLLAVDIGTTSTKGLAIQSNGEVLAHFRKGYPTHYPQPGYAEQDSEQVFQAVVEVITQTIRQAKGKVQGISFSCAMHSLMAVDKDVTPLTPLILWGDTRSSKQAAALRNSELGKIIYRQSGTPVHPMSPLSKLLWMKEEQPGLFFSAHKFISFKEFVFARFFGEYVIDYSIASATGLFDVQNLTWSKEALKLIGLSELRLSKPVSPLYICSKLKTEFAKEIGIAEDTPFIVGANDGCLAHLGSGAMNPGDLSVTIGTSGAVRMATKGFSYDEQERIFNYRLDEKSYIAGGATNNGAVILAWFEEHVDVAKPDSAGFVDEAFSVPGSEKLIFLPYLLGERAPMYDPLARGVFFGLTIKHQRAHFKRAMLEGICFELRSIARAVEEVVHPVKRVIASGGFVKSDLWVQLLSDILNKPILVNSQDDASSLGAALQGFQALGVKADFQNRTAQEKSFAPNPANREHYQKLFEIHESLYDKLKSDFERLDEL